jgi:hypothetical protein
LPLHIYMHGTLCVSSLLWWILKYYTCPIPHTIKCDGKLNVNGCLQIVGIVLKDRIVLD